MLSKNEVNYIKSLYNKKQRNEHKLFIAEGKKIVDELMQSSLKVKTIYATKHWTNNTKNNCELIEISSQELEKISSLHTPNQVLAIVEMPEPNNNIDFENTFTLALDGIQDPGNLGTIIRIADWFGIKNIICSKDCVDIYNTKTIQSTMGSFIRVNVVYDDLENQIKACEVPVFGAFIEGLNVKNIEKHKQGLLLIGNEGNGIRTNIASLIDKKISIEKIGNAESLNASVATGILLSHLI